ncbi:MAG: HAMP domain-containing sensor histidine kinase [Gammaproteobacteria bacterium]|jgi:signal transduction histidine kinase
MSPNRGLGRRLVRDLLLQAVYISIAAIVSVFAVGVLMEDVLIKQALESEAEYYRERLVRDPDAPLPDTRNLTVYREGPATTVPAWMRDLEPGYHRREKPKPVLALVTEHQGQRLYLVFDSANVKELVAFFGLVPLALVLIVIYLSLYRAYQVSRRAVSPVVALAEKVQQLDPSAPDARPFSDAALPKDSDEEIRVLTSAIRGLTERLTDFVERERNFTRDASHELRSPLTVIKIGANILLKDSALDDPARESVIRIKDAATDMEELTEAFLLLARESEQQLNQEWVSVNQIVDREVERARVVAQTGQVEIEVRPQSSLSVEAPEKVLASVIGNLLRNGVSYTDSGTVGVTIDTDCIVIEDTGPGMAPEEVEQVFKPFYRAQRRRGGHGVGLTIVKRLSDRFGWPLHIDSTPGAGTRVTVRFPHSRSEPAVPAS